MKMKAFLAIAGLSLGASGGFMLATVTPAAAAKSCLYRATNGSGWNLSVMATARNETVACRRAKRRCNRKLGRAKVPRGQITPSCQKYSTYHPGN